MSPRLPFDTLYSIFSLLPMKGELYREDRRLYNSVEELGLPVPLTNTKDITSCASVCRAWNVSAQRHLLREVRVVNHAHCAYFINLTSDPLIGRDIRTLEFINGTRRPGSHTLKADITQRDVVALVKNCPSLRTLTLFGCRMSNESLEELVCDASLKEIIMLGLSRQASFFTLRTIKRFLESMPKLRAFSCPPLDRNSEDFPPAPTTKLQAALADVNKALKLTGHRIQRLRIPAAAFVPQLLPLCPKLRHLEVPVLEVDFMHLLACITTCIATSPESLTLFSDRYIGGKEKATLSASDTLVLIHMIQNHPKLRTLKLLDLCLTYHENAYPLTPGKEFGQLKTLCAQRGIRFPCPDVSRLKSGPRRGIPTMNTLYGDSVDMREYFDDPAADPGA